MKRFLSVALSLGLLLSALAGCSQDSAPGGAEGGGNSITVRLETVGNNLDPNAANAIDINTIATHIYDTLLRCDENLEVQPCVASSWEQPDPLTYVLTISDGFKFHNGEDLEMEDAIYSLTRLENIAQAASLYAQIDTISSEGDQMIVKLKEADSSFPRRLSEVFVFNKSYCEEAGDDYANKPVGTGPYTLSEFVPGEKAVLTAWADYPGDKPSIETITFKGISEDSTAYMAVEAGDINFTKVDATDYERARANEDLTFYQCESTSTSFVAMNTQAAPFDNVNVRRAMAYAFDKESYLSVQGENFFTIDSMFPNMTAYYSSSDYAISYDPEEAKKLLEAEGYNESNPLTFEIILYSESPVMQAYQADLAAIGVQVELTTLEFGVFLDDMANQNFQMLIGSWSDVVGNPLSSAECYWSGSLGSQNVGFYVNPVCDELYSVAKTSSDNEEVIDACRQIQDIAWQDVPMFPTFGRSESYAYNKNLSGVIVFPSGVLSFRTAALG